MKQYKFTTKAQDDAKIKEIKKLKEEKEAMKGKKLLKEATFTVTTVDDAIIAIQSCMEMIATKKRNVNIISDIVGSSIISGIDKMVDTMVGTASMEDDIKALKLSNIFKKKIMMTIRNSIAF